MAVRVVEEGFVRIEPDVLDWPDVLETAQELINEHGWVKGDSGDENRGFSLHGAVGTAAARLTGEGKDAPVARTLRQDATKKLTTAMGKDYEGAVNADITWNDKQDDGAKGKNKVIALIKKALNLS